MWKTEMQRGMPRWFDHIEWMHPTSVLVDWWHKIIKWMWKCFIYIGKHLERSHTAFCNAAVVYTHPRLLAVILWRCKRDTVSRLTCYSGDADNLNFYLFDATKLPPFCDIKCKSLCIHSEDNGTHQSYRTFNRFFLQISKFTQMRLRMRRTAVASIQHL